MVLIDDSIVDDSSSDSSDSRYDLVFMFLLISTLCTVCDRIPS